MWVVLNVNVDMLLSQTAVFRRAIPADTSNDEEGLLQEWKPTVDNHAELLALMDSSRAARRAWITEAKPDAAAIMSRYPRFIDMNEAVSSVLVLTLSSCYTQHYCSVADPRLS